MKVAIAIGLGIAALLAGAYISNRTSSPTAAAPPELGAGYLLSPAKPLPALSLLDGHGRSFTEKDFAGAWSFLYFGYTYCPDVCPLSLLVLADVKKRLAEAHPGLAAKYYLVSVDPARDTPSRIGEYVAYFDPTFEGLTGDLGEIDRLAKAASVLYSIPAAEEGEPYLVAHSSTVTLVDPDGNIRAIFSSPLAADRIAADFAMIVGTRRETAE